ncbi:PREDICTED: endonuclease G, mitochondrial [Drosophila arizonae]|uniref:Endonuclease G, mitochondrial n=1 Tax=Drosophila arizonae TaxID=7263 RepID=A0ABM1PRS9_DROAR|nr:PREDICTED: endonuclease G, mitochondrial [Drosophila arizonae]
MLPLTLPLSLAVLTGLLGFFAGAVIQQDSSYRNLQSTMENDPYIYQSRQRIYQALRLVVQPLQAVDNDSIDSFDDTPPDWPSGDYSIQRRSVDSALADSVFANYIKWFQLNINTVTMFFTFSLGNEPVAEPEPTHVATLMKYGFPGLDDIHVYRNFVLSYDRRNRIAHWVCEHLESECLNSPDSDNMEIPTDYLIDSQIPIIFRAAYRDYKNTDWVAGHLASPENYCYDEQKYIETFIMPNIAPVSQGLKSRVWSRLEDYVRELAVKCGSVYVYTGPLFMPQRITFRNWAIRHQVIGMNTVAVPTHFFKVIIAECKGQEYLPYMEGYVVPNTEIEGNLELSAFMSNIRDIEHFAGLKFYDGQLRQQLHHNVQRHDKRDEIS